MLFESITSDLFPSSFNELSKIFKMWIFYICMRVMFVNQLTITIYILFLIEYITKETFGIFLF